MAAVENQQTRAVLMGLYRRLRIAGETPQMIRRTLLVYDLPVCVGYGRRLLGIHRELRQVDVSRASLRMWHLRSKLVLGGRRRVLLTRLLLTRLRLRSVVAVVNLLSSLLIFSVAFFIYQIYRTYRVGISQAEEKYATLAVPVLQTFEAMAAAEERRKLQRRAQMDEDIKRAR